MKDVINFTKTTTYLNRGWYYLAAIEVAEILVINNFKCSQSKIADFFDKKRWMIIEKEYSKQLEKACDILSFGSVWDEDEILLALSILLNLGLIMSLAKFLQLEHELSFEHLISKFNEINFNIPENKRAINSSVLLLDRNSKVKNWRSICEFDRLIS